MPDKGNAGSFGEVFRTALKLGLTSFGGPTAHIGYFRDEYVKRRGWLSESSFADLVALCQFLPGPASSQLGMAIGIGRAGMGGALAAWLGFTLPSAFMMLAFALAAAGSDFADSGLLQGLKLAAVAVVAQAVWNMGRTLAAGTARATMAIASAVSALLLSGAFGQLLPLLICAAYGYFWLQPVPQPAVQAQAGTAESNAPAPAIKIGYKSAWISLALFLVLFGALLAAKSLLNSPLLSLVANSYIAGSLVFGGGHVVLPFLEQAVVGTGAGQISAETFSAGYGAVQAMPGPLFTFSAYVGGAMAPGITGVLYGTAALIAIFLPSFLLLAAALPYWQKLKASRMAQGALAGINASVVGILLAALYDPIWLDAVRSPQHFAVLLPIFLILVVWKRQPWQIVLFASAAGWLFL